jgi:hypothetical protein
VPIVLSQRTPTDYKEDENIKKMCLASGSFLAKYFLCLLNLVFSVAGIASLVAGAWIVLGVKSFLEFIQSKFGDKCWKHGV